MSEYRLSDHVRDMPDEEYERLNVFQFRLLSYYIQNPISKETVRTIAEKTHMSIGAVSKAHTELTEMGHIIAANDDPSGYVYLLKADIGAYKIGMSVNPGVRIASYNTLPFKVIHVCTIKAAHARDLERCLHVRFAKKRVNGEWYKLSDDDVEYVNSLAVQA